MRIVHFADLHLDSRLRLVRPPRGMSRRTAASLCARRSVTSFNSHGTNKPTPSSAVVTFFEAEYVTPDTASFLRESFAAVAPLQVFIALGNHDYYAAGQHDRLDVSGRGAAGRPAQINEVPLGSRALPQRGGPATWR